MKSILVVEDNDSTLQMMVLLLNSKGYLVHGCKTAMEAQRAIAATMPDILLTDYFLAGMDGMDLACWTRDQPGGDHPKIALITAAGTGMMEAIRDRLAKCRVEVVYKPFEPANLYEQLGRLSRELDKEDSRIEGEADG